MPPRPPEDLDATRAAIYARELVATTSGYLTADVAMSLPFEALGPFKQLLLRFFSPEAWTAEHAAELSGLVAPHVAEGCWEHDLGGGITLEHGIRDGEYLLHVTGGSGGAPSIFDRVFSGPVVPEATPHPRKVKFTIGGSPAPGIWYRRGDEAPADDPRVRRLFGEPDVTDVMVAGDFVTIGIGARSPWERRLEPLLALVTELFAGDVSETAAPERTREDLLAEAGLLDREQRAEDLHLLDPDDATHRARLLEALDDESARVRRVAVAVLAEAGDRATRNTALERGRGDRSLQVRRTALDVAGDTGDEALRSLFEAALDDSDPWTRWRAVRALGDLGVEPSRGAVAALDDDPEFRVRFEASRVLQEWD